MVLAVALAASVTAVRGGFVYDDVPVVRDDVRLHSLRNLPVPVSAPYWSGDFADRMYRPLTTASFAADRALGGGSPAVFHAVNVGLHLAVTALVLLLAARAADAPRFCRTVWEPGFRAFDRGDARAGERDLLAAARLGRCAEARARYEQAGALASTDAAKAEVRRRLEEAATCRPAR